MKYRIHAHNEKLRKLGYWACPVKAYNTGPVIGHDIYSSRTGVFILYANFKNETIEEVISRVKVKETKRLITND